MGIYQRASGTDTLKASVNASALTNSTVTLTVQDEGTTGTHKITATISTGETCNFANATGDSATKQGLFGFTASSYTTCIYEDFQVTQ